MRQNAANLELNEALEEDGEEDAGFGSEEEAKSNKSFDPIIPADDGEEILSNKEKTEKSIKQSEAKSRAKSTLRNTTKKENAARRAPGGQEGPRGRAAQGKARAPHRHASDETHRGEERKTIEGASRAKSDLETGRDKTVLGITPREIGSGADRGGRDTLVV